MYTIQRFTIRIGIFFKNGLDYTSGCRIIPNWHFVQWRYFIGCKLNSPFWYEVIWWNNFFRVKPIGILKSAIYFDLKLFWAPIRLMAWLSLESGIPLGESGGTSFYLCRLFKIKR